MVGFYRGVAVLAALKGACVAIMPVWRGGGDETNHQFKCCFRGAEAETLGAIVARVASHVCFRSGCDVCLRYGYPTFFIFILFYFFENFVCLW